MPLIQLLVLAVIQGITEFLPISSSAHLKVLPQIIEAWEQQDPAIDVAAHVGSLGAVIIYFWRETQGLARGGVDTLLMRKTDDGRLFAMIAVATIPLVMIGGVLAITGVDDKLDGPRVIALASIGFGILLWVADRAPTEKNYMPNTWRAALILGGAQAVAVIPGTSRSGITITAARFMGFERDDAARFSMLMAIPAIAIAGAWEGLGLIKDGSEAAISSALIVGIASFFAAWAAIAVFMKLTRTISFTPFVIYRIALGLLLLAMFS